MAEHEEGLLGWLDGPRLVVGGFAFFILGLTVLGILLWSDQQRQVQRIDAIVMQRLAEEKAAKAEQVNACFSRAVQGPTLRRVLVAIESEMSDLANRQQLRDFRQLNDLNTPTIQECRDLAKRLNVAIPKGVR